MITKLLALLGHTKGAAAAAVIAAAGLTTGVVATNEDARTAVTNVVETVTNTANSANQPAVVASRNDADNKLREAFRVDQQKIEKLRGTQVDPADRSKLGDTLKTADEALRARLTKALDDVSVLTLGRNGLDPSASPGKPSGPPDVKVAFTTETQAKIDDIVQTAMTDMDEIAAGAEKAVAAFAPFTPGKPAGRP
jgi:hypothetical protein